MFPNSLAFRLLAITTAWTVIALLITGLILSTVFQNRTEQDFQRLLLAHAYNLMGAVEIGADGKLAGEPNLGDPRFNAPLSGWYWAVSTAEKSNVLLMHSRSISGEDLHVQGVEELPFDSQFRRVSQVEGANSITTQRLEAQLYVGEGDTLYQVLVAGNKSDIQLAVSDFNKTLALFFAVFGVGAILTTFIAIRLGLKPLDRAVGALQDVREGRKDHLEGEYPTEINPLANEINALIEANRTVMQRARTQVGNLAHALKTPIAVLLNEVRKPGKNTPTLVSEQAQMMQTQVQTYLNRARIAAQRDVITARTEVAPVVAKLVRVMKKLSPQLEFNVQQSELGLIFKGEEQDLEEVLGNLLDNASRFARSKIQIAIDPIAVNSDEMPKLCISVSDDGSGLTATQRQLALRRGQRLDESQPGSGLGLSIVDDIAMEYGGELQLTDSCLGGLCATAFLPRRVAKPER